MLAGRFKRVAFVHMSKAMKPPELRKYFDNFGAESVRLFTQLLADF